MSLTKLNEMNENKHIENESTHPHVHHMNDVGSSGKGPEAKFKAGAVSATIWKNQSMTNPVSPHGMMGGQGILSYYSVNLDRNYKNKQGVWQKTSSLRLNDLPKAALVLNKAYEYLAMSNEQ